MYLYFYNFHKRTRQNGFSLIELLIVIAVIGILTAAITANFQVSREKAKNKAVMSSFKEMQLALELYKSQHGAYPSVPGVPPACVGGDGDKDNSLLRASGGCSDYEFIEGVTPDFLDVLPTPAMSAVPSTCRFIYYVDAVSQSWYKLVGSSCMSDAYQVEADDEFVVAPSYCDGTQPGGREYAGDAFDLSTIAIYSPGGECY